MPGLGVGDEPVCPIALATRHAAAQSPHRGEYGESETHDQRDFEPDRRCADKVGLM
jgi:hypothetical protein